MPWSSAGVVSRSGHRRADRVPCGCADGSSRPFRFGKCYQGDKLVARYGPSMIKAAGLAVRERDDPMSTGDLLPWREERRQRQRRRATMTSTVLVLIAVGLLGGVWWLQDRDLCINKAVINTCLTRLPKCRLSLRRSTILRRARKPSDAHGDYSSITIRAGHPGTGHDGAGDNYPRGYFLFIAKAQPDGVSLTGVLSPVRGFRHLWSS